ncbi:MAG TPA: low affinity iron permease family protein [Thermoanaerobaculia bacterium]|nr:low affinity iron permease family protein [Thermoanaerobaculia bacterium]
MEAKSTSSGGPLLERFSQRVSQWTGSSWAFVLALGFVLLWAVTGPMFGFSQGWPPGEGPDRPLTTASAGARGEDRSATRSPDRETG